MTTFRRSAHRRLVADLQRGRLLLQLAFVADAEATAIYDPYEWPRVSFGALSPQHREELDYFRALGNELATDAARRGVRGGTDAAFGYLARDRRTEERKRCG